MKKLIVFITFFCVSLGWTQEEFFYKTLDTLSLDYRSGGVTLDSIDASFIGELNLRSAAGFEQVYEFNLAKNLFNTVGGFTYLEAEKKVKPMFVGLPYLGFKYAFGSHLTQDMNVEYQHFFRRKTHLHFRYNRRSSNGFLRNSKYELNDLSLMFYHSKGIYSANLKGYFGLYNIQENGGIESDSLLDVFAINFIPVNKDNANTKVRRVNFNWDNYFRIIGDSIVGTGLKTRHHFNLVNREFSEHLFDLSKYPILYLDTLGDTRDQYQTAEIGNGAGIYFTSNYFKIDATVNHQYWGYQNNGKFRDTNELVVQSNLFVGLGKKIELRNQFYFNFLGAIGELKDYIDLDYSILRLLTFNAKVNFENVYPTPYQRFHTANYYQWNIEDLKMQQKLQVVGSVRYGKNNFVSANVVWTNINNGRYFIDNQWRQDTLGLVSMGVIELKGGFRYKGLGVYPTATLRFGSSNYNFQPIFSTMSRISYETMLFKKKLGMAVGIDVGYQTKYKYLTYNDVLGLMMLNSNTGTTDAMMKLNAFLALSIDQFRFFIKAENISSYFTDRKIRIDQHYPIMPFLVRVGITWDFFN